MFCGRERLLSTDSRKKIEIVLDWPESLAVDWLTCWLTGTVFSLDGVSADVRFPLKQWKEGEYTPRDSNPEPTD